MHSPHKMLANQVRVVHLIIYTKRYIVRIIRCTLSTHFGQSDLASASDNLYLESDEKLSDALFA